MSDPISTIIDALNSRIAANGKVEFGVKFAMPGHTPIFVDALGVRQEDGDADVTLTVTAENLAAILTGQINPAMAFISGKIQVSGDYGKASALKSILL